MRRYELYARDKEGGWIVPASENKYFESTRLGAWFISRLWTNANPYYIWHYRRSS